VCADAHSFSLLEESSLTGVKVNKALPYLEAKAKKGQEHRLKVQ
jgi:hypothetical protein